MAAVEWPFTRLGTTFFEGTLPRLCKVLERIAAALEKEHEATLATAPPGAGNAEPATELLFEYRNHRDERATRRVLPIVIWHGRTPYYEGKRTYLRAHDLDKDDVRDFDLSRIEAPQAHRNLVENEG